MGEGCDGRQVLGLCGAGGGGTETAQLLSGMPEVFGQFSRWTLNQSLEDREVGVSLTRDGGRGGGRAQLVSSNCRDCDGSQNKNHTS